MSSASNLSEWVSGTQAAALLGCVPKQVPKLAAKGFITVRRLPGCDPRYLLSDIERLANQATTPANQDTMDSEEFTVPAPGRQGTVVEASRCDQEGGRR